MKPNFKGFDKKQKRLQESGTLNPHPDTVTDTLFQQRPFFDSSDLLQVKYEMLRCVEKDGRSVSRAVQDFGFSRRHFYVIQKQFTEAGFQGLMPEKRGPRKAHKLDDEVMRFVRATIADKPALKAPALALLIQNKFQRKVHPRSIEKALARKKNSPKK
ncbi:MAG: helix-turn-helix domain-containing protein [Gammaproteobacteria bacterium]|nr:helix-turn-helix domain-containing protein [Gammaproteobacteria bacterium]